MSRSESDAGAGAADMKRYLILAACILMLACLGTGQAWSVFEGPLQREYGWSSLQTQTVFCTVTFFFCLVLVFAGRLHDRVGPRPLALVSSVIVGSAWLLAMHKGASYGWLWLAMGVLGGTGAAIGYVCPLATAVKWFPNRRGLISGLAAAGFASGPILLSIVAEMLYALGWRTLDIFHLVGFLYTPTLFILALCLSVPPGKPGELGADEAAAFRRRSLLRDRRFWTLCVGMLCGTLPYLTVMGTVKKMGAAFGIGAAAMFGVAVIAAGNAAGRIAWGHSADRLGPDKSGLAALATLAGAVLVLLAFGRLHPAVFLAAACVVGFCYGSNFAIYPAAVAHLYGTHVLGTVYPLIMAAQGISSFAPTLNGFLVDRTKSYVPGLVISLVVTLGGLVVCARLTAVTSDE